MAKTATTNGKARRPSKYKTQTYVKWNGQEIVGLKRRPDGRHYAADEPSKTFGRDAAEAVRKFRKWQSQRKRATVSIEQPLGESWIGEKLKAKFPDHKVTIKSNAVWETVVDDAAFWQKVTAFLRDPNGQRIAAQRTGNHPT
jgi:hypothetical protein